MAVARTPSQCIDNPNYRFLPPVIIATSLTFINRCLLPLNQVPASCSKTFYMSNVALGLISTVELQRRNHAISRESYTITLVTAGVSLASAVMIDLYDVLV